MVCPDCQGLGFIKVPGMCEVSCPTCEGLGVLDDTPALNHCSACGEPLNDGQRWCEEHRAAELFEPK
jgi:DnaJ-class molecular chaperone